MVLYYLRKKGQFSNFPFWAGTIAMAWFFPQALGGYFYSSRFPENSYWQAMLFASLCSLFLWAGYIKGLQQKILPRSWLSTNFDGKALYLAGMTLCIFGFFFEWKLLNLPDELLNQSQWSGITVRYLFLAGAFKIGFITIWLLYLHQPKWFIPSMLLFLIPSLILLLMPVLLHGRRAGMMNLAAYIIIGLWFTRRISFPRWFIITGLICGLLIINGIGVYRNFLHDKSIPLLERLQHAVTADYLTQVDKISRESGPEFINYIYFRKAIADNLAFDFGLRHWNMLIFNYGPAQIVGKKVKNSLLIDLPDEHAITYKEFGHIALPGTTITGYFDSYASFGWLGFVKFFLIGLIMGKLHKNALQGKFLGQLLYLFFITSAMHAITHSTNRILVSNWIYFFLLGYPVLHFAKKKSSIHYDKHSSLNKFISI
jgi:hypothetical protein